MMLVETTVKEILESVIKGEGKITDNSVCGKCSKCGECCTSLLPISQEELDTIQKYVIKNKIRPQSHMLVMQNRLCCPYYNGKKCLIYEVRPLICREFYCYKEPSYEMSKKFSKDKYITVDMWGIAKEIDKQYLCYTCAGCLQEENETFAGVYRCQNYIKKERAKDEIQFRDIRKSGRERKTKI